VKQVFLASVAASVLLAAGAAQAQTEVDVQSNFARDRNVSVRERPKEGYEAIGLRTGAFMVYPRVTVDLEHNDNVFAHETNEQEDLIVRLRPEVSIESGWSRHALQAYARASINRFQDFEEENTDDYIFGARGRIDVVGRSFLFGGVELAQMTEPRTNAGVAQFSAEPVRYDVITANVGGTHELNRLRLTGRYDVQEYDYEDVAGGLGLIDQDDRDRTQHVLSGKAEYAVSPALAVFGFAAANTREYEEPTPVVTSGGPVLAERDSEGYELAVGANFDITNLSRGEIQVGYLRQEYDNPVFGEISGLAVLGQLEWFPTQLTTITLRARRAVEDSGVPGSPGYLASTFRAQIDHELLRNLILTADATFGSDEFEGIDRDDERFAAGVSATYLMNRHVGLSLGYAHFNQDSSGVDRGPNFAVNRVLASLILQY